MHAYHLLDRHTREHLGDFPATIEPGGAILIGSGLTFVVPFPIDCQVRPRSGLASKFDVELSNSPGTIDPDFRGEAGILLRNRGNVPFIVQKGMRVAQILFTRVEIPKFVIVDQLPATQRNTGGFGSTGLGALAGGDEEYQREQARLDRHFMRVAMSAAGLSDCLRGVQRVDGQWPRDVEGGYIGVTRYFGCVLVKDGNIIGQGRNRRSTDCNECDGCIRERLGIPTGTSLELGCIHAEIDALQSHARTGGSSLVGATAYCTGESCVMCSKTFTGCGITAVVVPEGTYPTNGLPILQEAGIEVRRIKM
jgi:dUTP pyrophosphatase